MLLLNFSHPLSVEQLTQAAVLAGEPIEEVREVFPHFDSRRSFPKQAQELLDGLGLPAEAWRSRPLLVNLPGHSLIAGVLLAELHGRMGRFPAVLQLEPAGGRLAKRFVVREIVNLQAVRDRAGQGSAAAEPPAVSPPVRAPRPVAVNGASVSSEALPAWQQVLPETFRLARFEFALEAYDDLHLPEFKGSTLRGGFGETFKASVCSRNELCGERCLNANACAYGYIFETSVMEDGRYGRQRKEVPRPFVIQAPADERELIPAGDLLTFGLTLVGEGLNYLPYFVLFFRELGQAGIGRGRGRFHLAGVDWVDPFGRGREAIYRGHDELLRVPEAGIDERCIQAYAATLPEERIRLEFVTPTRLVDRRSLVHEAPSFQLLVRTLLRRVSELSYFHCGADLPVDFRALINEAAGVRLVESRVNWLDRVRVSRRQRRFIPIDGLVGRVTYAGDLRPYRPLLVLGELLHLGKGTVFGNGQMKIARSDSEER